MTPVRHSLLFCLLLICEISWAQSFCVTKPGIYLRKTASSKAAVSWQVPKYMPLLGTGKRQGSFWEVKDVDSQVHWVAAHDVSTKISCLVVRVKSSRLRMGPGKSFQASPLGIADRYMAFSDLGGEEGWTQVQDEDGEKAWLSIDHTWKANKKSRVSFEGT